MNNKQKKREVPQIQNQSIQPIQISVQAETLRGVYSNVALIQHTENEFVFDFLLKLGDKGQLVSRVILSPEHAAKFLDALKTNHEKYLQTVKAKKTNAKN